MCVKTKMSVSSLNTHKIAKNTFMLYIRMLLTMLVALYTSRVVLEVLGVEDFGIYNVVGGIVTMFSFLNGKQTKLRIRKEYLKVQPQIILPVMGLGLASFVMKLRRAL